MPRKPWRRRCTRLLERRSILKTALQVGLGLRFIELGRAQAGESGESGPQEDDRLVFAFGEKRGEVITLLDLPVGGPQIFAYPMDPETRLAKDGSRLNQIMLVRFDPAELTEETRMHSAEGAVAYSAVCTHTGCDVSEWNREAKHFLCPCHYSEFDPRDGARVLNGPAPRRLAILPLKMTDGVLMAAAGFIGRVGFKKG